MKRRPLQVTIWNEYFHEQTHPQVQQVYPAGIHRAIEDGLRGQMNDDTVFRTATLEEPQHGLSPDVLQQTDVLLWWGHARHGDVDDQIVEAVHQRVLQGMGLLALHSAHLSKIFVKLMGTSCMLRWREAAERERIWIVDPSHPIVEGIEGEYFELDQTEMYGEYFDIPTPDELIAISWFEGGEVFRSACTFRRGKGKIFYFRPGHETFPIYYHPQVLRILANGVRWAAPSGSEYFGEGRHIPTPIQPLSTDHRSDDTLH